MNLQQLCDIAVHNAASDLILHEGSPLALKINGSMARVDAQPVTAGALDELYAACRAPGEARDYDAAFVADSGERFRVNIFRNLGRRGAVMRHIRSDIPELEHLGVPAGMLRRWLQRRSGIILVTGPAGSGKSTTLAACIEDINETSARHVVTIEDPIEFVFRDNCCVFTQREVGIDTDSFAEGLRQSLRQAPDVLFIGEIRDPDSAVTAIQASETGHLILGTVHASDATDALDRMARLLPEAEQRMLSRTFAGELIGVLAQRLLPSGTEGVALATEYFENIGAVRKYIEEGRSSELRDLIERSDSETSQSMLQSVAALCRAGTITEKTALSAVERPAELSRLLRGISSTTLRR